jgi:hypothetical protein
VLLRLHETLCFLQAYPDDATVLAAVTRALDGFPARVGGLGRAAREALHDSGVADTTLDYPFGFPMARWLARRFPRHVGVVWRSRAGVDRVREALSLLVHPMEEEAFGEFGLEWQDWLQLAKIDRRFTDLELLVGLFETAAMPSDARDWLFERLALPIAWTLHGVGASRTLARLPCSHPFFRRGQPLARQTAMTAIDVTREITRSLPSLRRAPRDLAERIIDAARGALATRLRELHGISYANPDDVLVADPGRGLRVALIGVLPEQRLPLESFYGYLILQNGVPIGYGGAWHLFRTLEFGVNIFETFRPGESTRPVVQVLRTFYQALGMHTVVLQPFQIGHGNPEALESGAFHFYYRIGFRPRDPRAVRLTRQEQERIALSAAYRSPPTVLKQLARAEMSLAISTGAELPERRITARQLAALATARIAGSFGGDRDAATRWASTRVARALNVRGYGSWPAGQRRAFQQLSLIAALIPDLSDWSAADKIRLGRALRAKGGPSEVPYVRLLDGHRRLQKSLRALLATDPWLRRGQRPARGSD